MFERHLANNEIFKPLTHHLSHIKETIQASAASGYIIKDSKVIYEWYNGTYDDGQTINKAVTEYSKFNIASIRKIFLGLLISLAIEEHKINSLDDLILEYMDLDQALYASVTIRHLVTHTHGISKGNKLFPAGYGWHYSNDGVNILIDLISQLYNSDFPSLIEERLFKPYQLNLSGWYTERDESLIWINEEYKAGNPKQANLFMSTADLALWGQLQLTDGYLNGKQYISEHVFHRARCLASPTSLNLLSTVTPRQAFFWFYQDIPRDCSEIGNQLPIGTIQSLGKTNCACLVIPTLDAVVVRMFNQTGENPPQYSYLDDIKQFGHIAYHVLQQYR